MTDTDETWIALLSSDDAWRALYDDIITKIHDAQTRRRSCPDPSTARNEENATIRGLNIARSIIRTHARTAGVELED